MGSSFKAMGLDTILSAINFSINSFKIPKEKGDINNA